jgi:hypothetical protein
MRVSFDFDNTISEVKMQELAKKYLELGTDVFITTSRASKIKNAPLPNKDLFDVAESLGIKKENIKFTEYEDKYLFVKDFDVHYDDDEMEIDLINRFPSKCIGFLYNSNNNNQIADF